jgi:anthranilate phosphoribosyltransferase
MDLQQAIDRVIHNGDLSSEEMQSVMRVIMQGEATPAQIGGFLVGLRMKGETVTEIAAAAGVMRALADQVDVQDPHLVDVVGTGGDGSHTFNISTAASFVAAAAGARVAKHGNRSASGTSGSADLLELAGARLDLTSAQVGECISTTGIGFMFAPRHHGAMKYAVGPRKELGARTIFNMLGPLTNPAGVRNQLVGVYAADLVRTMAEVLQKLGSLHALVVHSDDGLDEISIAAPTRVAELKDGGVLEFRVTPEQFGMERAGLEGLRIESVQDSLQLVNAVFDDQPGAARDIVCINAGAAIYAAGVAESLAAGVIKAQAAVTSGAARQKFNEFIAFTRKFISS